MPEKICTLTDVRHQRVDGWWWISYDGFGAGVTKEIAPEIETLKKGDKILITTDAVPYCSILHVEKLTRRGTIGKMIHSKQHITVTIGAETFEFEGVVIYDSLLKPPHRVEAYDRLGNAVFVMLESE